MLIIKQLCIVPIIGALILLFSEKSITQTNTGSSSIYVEVNGKNETGNVQFFHNSQGNKVLSPENVVQILEEGDGIFEFDKITIKLNGKSYKGSAVSKLEYSEDKADRFMRNLSGYQGIFSINTEKASNSKKVRKLRLEVLTNGDIRNHSITYNDDLDYIPPPPPPPPAPKPAPEPRAAAIPIPPPPPPGPEPSPEPGPEPKATPVPPPPPPPPAPPVKGEPKAPPPPPVPAPPEQVAPAPLPPPPPPPPPPGWEDSKEYKEMMKQEKEKKEQKEQKEQKEKKEQKDKKNKKN
jgi:hypothetical protein